MKSGKWLHLTGVFLATYLVALLIFLPATAANSLLQQVSDDRLLLGEVAGSFWSGQGALFIRPAPSGEPASQALSLGKISWQIAEIDILHARIGIKVRQNPPAKYNQDASKESADASGEALFHLSSGLLEVQQMDVTLSATTLSVLSPIIAAMAPGGVLRIRTQKFSHEKMGDAHRFDGTALLDWDNATLSDGRTAGNYRIALTGQEAALHGDLATKDGILDLQGKCSWRPGEAFRLNAHVRLLPGGDGTRNNPLLRSLCPKGGDQCTLAIGPF